MAGTELDVVRTVVVVLRSTAAGFAFGETAFAAADHTLTSDGPLLAALARAAEHVGVAGAVAVTACLVFSIAIISMGTGLLFAAMVMHLLKGGGAYRVKVSEAAAGVSIAVGATATGAFTSVLPTWPFALIQCIIVLVVYSYKNSHEMAPVLSVIFTTLYLSVVFGRMGFITGLGSMGFAISFLCALRKAILEKVVMQDKGNRSQWSERLLLYSVVMVMVGFPIGLGFSVRWNEGSELDASLMLGTVLWVGVLSAGVLGAALGAVAAVSLGPEGAGRMSLGAAVTSSVALRLLLPASNAIGARCVVGGLLGGATAAGVSLGSASIAAEAEFKTRPTLLVVLGSVVMGAVLGSGGLTSGVVILGLMELITVGLIAVGAFILGAPKSPFHTPVYLHGGLLTGPTLLCGIGKETVTAAAAPLGAGALGAAGLFTAALGKVGTVGALLATAVALGKTWSGVGGLKKLR